MFGVILLPPRPPPLFPGDVLVCKKTGSRQTHKFTMAFQFARPTPRSADTIGAWKDVFRTLCFVAVFANIATLFLALDMGFSREDVQVTDISYYTLVLLPHRSQTDHISFVVLCLE